MRWMIREDQLDPEQRNFIDIEIESSDNLWLQGFAGSGKSVLLVHALKDVLRRQPNAKILVVVYTHSLIDMFRTGLREVGMNAIEVVTYFQFQKKSPKHYDYIFCDEVQDMPEDVVREMAARSRQLFLAGDVNQSIYEDRVNPDMIGQLAKARPYTLSIIHRLTPSIINAVEKFLPEMGIFTAKQDATKQDVKIRLCGARTLEEEYEYVYKEAQKGAGVGDSSAILLPSHDDIIHFTNIILGANGMPKWKSALNQYYKPDFGNLNRYLKEKDVQMEYIGNGYGGLEQAVKSERIILMTYHSAKGLDFDNVFLPNQDARLRLHPSRAETLYMVAMTRSKKNLYLSYDEASKLCRFVRCFEADCDRVSIGETNGTVMPNTFNF